MNTNRKRTATQSDSKPASKPKVKAATLDKEEVEKVKGSIALNIELKALSDLRPHPKNPRKHPEQGTPEWEALSESLKHDYFSPLVWNKRNGMLVSGHLRRKVMLANGVTHADVVVVDYDEATHVQRMLAANKSIGKDDKGKATSLLDELVKQGITPNLTGFSMSAIDKMLGSMSESLDEVNREPDYPITAKLGEKHDYVLIYTDNETDRAFLHSILEIRREKSFKSTTVGLGRVVMFKRFLEQMVKNMESLKAQQ